MKPNWSSFISSSAMITQEISGALASFSFVFTNCLVQSNYTLGWPCEARRALVLLVNEAGAEKQQEERGRERLAAGCATHPGVSAKVANRDYLVHHFFPTQYALPGRDSGSDGTGHL